MEQIHHIAGFILNSFIHIWPYLLITIPLAVLVQLSGASKYINRSLNRNPYLSILLATVVGAFSPFCSCGVIPVVASLLIGGVPLAPVMSFWIASPSMDPEIFFLSTATIGWKLSIWRLIATFTLSLLSGYTTHILFKKGILGEPILKKDFSATAKKPLRIAYVKILEKLRNRYTLRKAQKEVSVQLRMVSDSQIHETVNCCIPIGSPSVHPGFRTTGPEEEPCKKSCTSLTVPFQKKLLNETWKASALVAKFMTLAFFVNALIHFYVPQEFLSNLLGGNSSFAVIVAAIIGVPVYTSNITALPLISGLLELGMNQGAALAFLISGPVTTLPAMAAVWGLVRRKIVVIYVSFALFGAILFGVLMNIIN